MLDGVFKWSMGAGYAAWLAVTVRAALTRVYKST